jgi:hypothetical protein
MIASGVGFSRQTPAAGMTFDRCDAVLHFYR